MLVFRDVGERVRLDNLLKDMQATAQVGGWEYDVATHKMHWTEAVYAIHDLPFGQPIELEASRNMFQPGGSRRSSIEAARQALDTGKAATCSCADQRARPAALGAHASSRRSAAAARAVRLHGTFQDVTDRVIAERQLRETRDFFELTLECRADAGQLHQSRLDHHVRQPGVRGMARRLPPRRCVGKRLRELHARRDAHDARCRYVDAVLRGERVQRHAHRHRVTAARASGRTTSCRRSTPNGAVRGFFSIIYDLTEQKRLEARLLQAQKMEAIGQLTGGIAHDFNNLLGVVLGNLQLLERSVAETPTLARKVHTAMRAAVRGADLTRRLLAFARRQILDPDVVDLNRQLSGLTELMQRTLGESIEVRMVQAHDLWHTRVDAGQFENAILNLAINARDAMPEGGRLTVRTQNVGLDAIFCSDHPQIEPGEYVSISVSDTGVGIEPDVLKRVFEPFFTTKESGQGQRPRASRWCDGFAEQAGGVATIESTVGRGHDRAILLPRCMRRADACARTRSSRRSRRAATKRSSSSRTMPTCARPS